MLELPMDAPNADILCAMNRNGCANLSGIQKRQ
jgi:hypothetical protein